MARELSPAAQVAKILRRELKTRWPSVVFEVHSSNFAGGDAVDVRWQDGPTTRQVQAITGAYTSGSFDGMNDIYVTRSDKPTHPTAKYVQCHRSISFASYSTYAAKMARMFGIKLPKVERTGSDGVGFIPPAEDYLIEGREYFSHRLYRMIQQWQEETVNA